MCDGERIGSFLTGLKVGLLFVGTIVGAGFASGKEILTFFAGNTVSLVFAVIASGIFFYLTGLLFLNLGRRIPAGSLFKITEVLLKKYSLFFNFFLIFCYLILLAAMLAGVDALAKESIGYTGVIPIFSIIMLLLAILVVRKGIKGLLRINSVLVPLVVMFIIAVCFFSLSNITVLDSGNWAEKGMDFFTSIFNSVLYVSMNMILSSAILISAGKKMNAKQVKISSMTATIIITVILTLVLITCRLNYSQIQGMEMPMVVLALKISPYFGILSVIILSFAIFTTLISSLYPLKEYLDDFIKNERTLYIVLAVAGFLLSRIGFTYIITYIYPLQGIIGLVFIAFCTVYNIQSGNLKYPLRLKMKNFKIKKSKEINEV